MSTPEDEAMQTLDEMHEQVSQHVESNLEQFNAVYDAVCDVLEQHQTTNLLIIAIIARIMDSLDKTARENGSGTGYHEIMALLGHRKNLVVPIIEQKPPEKVH